MQRIIFYFLLNVECFSFLIFYMVFLKLLLISLICFIFHSVSCSHFIIYLNVYIYICYCACTFFSTFISKRLKEMVGFPYVAFFYIFNVTPHLLFFPLPMFPFSKVFFSGKLLNKRINSFVIKTDTDKINVVP